MTQANRDLTPYGHLLVRRAILRDDWIADAILDLASAHRTYWTPRSWQVLLKELRNSPDTIADWLVLNG